MTTLKKRWTKEELTIYILLTCAGADNQETEEEINMIKEKTDQETFNTIYGEFVNDDEDERLDKIDENIQHHEFAPLELGKLRREMYEIYFSDCEFSRMEKNLDRILDNIIY